MLPHMLIALTLQAPATAVNVVGRVEMRVGASVAPLVRFAEVPEAATVITYKDAFASLRLQSGSLVRMGPETQLAVNRLDYKTPAGRRRESFSVKVGHIWAGVLRLVGQESNFEVETGNAVAGVRGTSFFVSATAEGSSFVVDDGSVVVALGGREIVLDDSGAAVTIIPAGFGPRSHLSASALRALHERTGGARGVFGASYAGLIGASAHDGSAREAWRHELLGPGALIDTPFWGSAAWTPSLTTTNLNVLVHVPTAAAP